MITKAGSGDTGVVALYTSALADGGYTALVRLTEAVDPDTIVDLNLNGVRLQRAGSNNAPILSVVDLAPGDVFTYEISSSSSSAWGFEFKLYASGDVAYEAP